MPSQRSNIDMLLRLVQTEVHAFFSYDGPTVEEAARYLETLTEFSCSVDDLLLDAARRFERLHAVQTAS